MNLIYLCIGLLVGSILSDLSVVLQYLKDKYRKLDKKKTMSDET